MTNLELIGLNSVVAYGQAIEPNGNGEASTSDEEWHFFRFDAKKRRHKLFILPYTSHNTRLWIDAYESERGKPQQVLPMMPCRHWTNHHRRLSPILGEPIAIFSLFCSLFIISYPSHHHLHSMSLLLAVVTTSMDGESWNYTPCTTAMILRGFRKRDEALSFPSRHWHLFYLKPLPLPFRKNP